MHSAIVVVEKPQTFGPQQRQGWLAVGNQLKHVAEVRPTAVHLLGEWCFLVSLQTPGGLEGLGELLQIANGDTHRVVFFEKEPGWVRSTPEASAT